MCGAVVVSVTIVIVLVSFLVAIVIVLVNRLVVVVVKPTALRPAMTPPRYERWNRTLVMSTHAFAHARHCERNQLRAIKEVSRGHTNHKLTLVLSLLPKLMPSAKVVAYNERVDAEDTDGHVRRTRSWRRACHGACFLCATAWGRTQMPLTQTMGCTSKANSET